jgi:hypothetical protein
MGASAGQNFNVNTAASQGLQGAMAGTAAGMTYTPQDVQSVSYKPSMVGSTGYNPATMQAGQLSSTNMSSYMNPYESSVISGLQSDALRGQQMASNELGAQATRAGAFGGSRHGVAEGQMAGDIQNQLNNQIAGLRQSGYQNAQQMALADIQNRMTAGQTNVNALNQAGQFGASAANQAALQNQAALNAAGQFGASNAMQAQLANQSAGLQGAQQRLSAANQMGNLSNLGFGMGQTINQNLAQQGALQQALQQMTMDKASQQYQGYAQSPYTSLSAYTAALGGTPYGQTTTTTGTQPSRGLFDYMGMGLYGAGALGYKPFA